MSDLAQYVLSGLSAGCVFALVALGFVIVANVTGVYNFAQGDYVMVGGMIMVATQTAGWPLLVGVLTSAVAVALVALAQERLTVAPVRRRVGMLGLVIASLGFGIVLRGLALLIWDKDPLSLPSFHDGTFGLLGARLDDQTWFIWGTTVVVLIGVVGLFRFTITGKAMRACASNPTAARLLGIRTGRMSMSAFVLAGAISGTLGAMIVPVSGVSWDSGITVGLIGFIAAALAGFEHPGRAVLAGLGLGVVQSVGAGVISSEYRDAIVYMTLIVYLLGRDLFDADGMIRRIVAARATSRTKRPRRAVSRVPDAGDAVPDGPRFAWPMLVPVVALLLLALAPFFLESGSQELSSATFVVLAAIAATGLGLVMGLAGQFSLGQAAFVLVGGYTVAILTTKHGWDPTAALLAGVVLSVIGGGLIGAMTLRLQGFNLAIATLAIHLSLLVVVSQATSLTGGALGIIGIPTLTVLGLDLADPSDFYWAAMVVLVACLWVARNISGSRVGQALRAVGQDEDGARSMGINPFRLKLVVFVVSAGMAGLAGGLWAFTLQFAAPANWDFTLTISLVTYVIVGGIGSVYGGLIGAVVVGGLEYWIRYHATSGLEGASLQWELIMYGLLLVVFVLFFKDGLARAFKADSVTGGLDRLRRRRTSASGPPGADIPTAAGTSGAAR
ncbi:ABC transporter permease [Patulibacter sp.]|uniref:ABC transporter permease n=1 Tax=Patulibacter sp. TaxID=1912859 RepID=UPI002717D3B5|nr:ABC transporter permease [Patulibacter sp.]MDO9410848.1 ABC transporter permease [Patulibacter sp.]